MFCPGLWLLRRIKNRELPLGRASSAALSAVTSNDLKEAVMRVVKQNTVLNMEHWRWEIGNFF